MEEKNIVNATEKTLLAANMWIIFDFGAPNKRYKRFLSNGRPAFKSFIENLLLYDNVIIPTQDFLPLTLLLDVLGEDIVLNLISSNSLKFLRFKGAFCYIGNGGGLQTYKIFSEPDAAMPFSAPVNEAILWALNEIPEKHKDPKLPKIVLDATTEIDSNSLKDEIRHETYMDILGSPYLRNIFAIRNKYMDRLAGINAKEVRIYGGANSEQWKGDEIDNVLLLAATNLELHLMNKASCEDLMTSNPIGHILKAKVDRCLKGQVSDNTFTTLKEIANIPDIGEGVLTKQIDIKSLLRIKQSREGEAFRKWFHAHCRDDAKTMAKEYIKLMEQIPKINSLPLRILRFILTTGIGTIPHVGPLLGTVASITDSFFIDKWLHGSSPKFFIENLKQISK